MPFWNRPELSEHPEGMLTVPDDASEPARAAITAFNAGDFFRCRRLLRELDAADPSTDNAAATADTIVIADLEKRLRLDPVLLGFATASVLVLVFLAIWAVTISQ